MTAATYRRRYDRLYVRSMKAGSKEECDAIDRALRKLNAEYEASKAPHVLEAPGTNGEPSLREYDL